MEYEAKLHERTQDAGLFQVSGINWHEVNAKATGREVSGAELQHSRSLRIR